MEKLQNEKYLKCGCSNNSLCNDIYFLVNPSNSALNSSIYNEKEIKHIVIIYNDDLEDKDIIFNLTAGELLSCNLKNVDLDNTTYYNMIYTAKEQLNDELEIEEQKRPADYYFLQYKAHNITLLNVSINDPNFKKSKTEHNKKIIETFYLNKLMLNSPEYKRMLKMATKSKIYYYDEKEEILNGVFKFTGANLYKPLDEKTKYNNKKVFNLILHEQQSKKDLEHIIYMYNVSDEIYKTKKLLYRFKFKIEEIEKPDEKNNEGIEYKELLNIDITHNLEEQKTKKYEFNKNIDDIIDILNNMYIPEEIREFVDFITTDDIIETVEFEK